MNFSTTNSRSQITISLVMTTLDVPHVKTEVVKLLAVGESQANIAKQFGLDQSQVSRFASKDEIGQLIEEEQMRLAEAIPDVVHNVKN